MFPCLPVPVRRRMCVHVCVSMCLYTRASWAQGRCGLPTYVPSPVSPPWHRPPSPTLQRRSGGAREMPRLLSSTSVSSHGVKGWERDFQLRGAHDPGRPAPCGTDKGFCAGKACVHAAQAAQGAAFRLSFTLRLQCLRVSCLRSTGGAAGAGGGGRGRCDLADRSCAALTHLKSGACKKL